MSTKHTPGPWHIGMKPGPMVYGPLGEQIADLRCEEMLLPDEAEANRALILSAPNLLETLQDLIRRLDMAAENREDVYTFATCSAFVENARELLAKLTPQ